MFQSNNLSASCLCFSSSHNISMGEQLKSNTSGVNQPSSTFAACWRHPLRLLWLFVMQVACKLDVFFFVCFFSPLPTVDKVKAWKWWSECRRERAFFCSLPVHVHQLRSLLHHLMKAMMWADGVSPLHMKEKCRLFVFAVTTQEVQKVTLKTYSVFWQFFFFYFFYFYFFLKVCRYCK